MKKILHKLPLSVVAGLCLMGCGGNHTNNTDNLYSESNYYKIDTVYVLNTHPATHVTSMRLWATDKSGTDFQGTFELMDDVVMPQTGDIIVLASKPNAILDYYKVIKNLTAEKRKSEYMNSK
ncbi:MAG: hypothetical protein E7009_03950 [Alphaproteobacteria bacterium]|nr:hypothetical protein [Alphaproteobacteria bacterium]